MHAAVVQHQSYHVEKDRQHPHHSRVLLHAEVGTPWVHQLVVREEIELGRLDVEVEHALQKEKRKHSGHHPGGEQPKSRNRTADSRYTGQEKIVFVHFCDQMLKICHSG